MSELRWAVAWSLYWLGDFVSWWMDWWPTEWAHPYWLYNRLMKLSVDVQGDTDHGPWLTVDGPAW